VSQFALVAHPDLNVKLDLKTRPHLFFSFAMAKNFRINSPVPTCDSVDRNMEIGVMVNYLALTDGVFP
jgi:hypothetical protein